MKNKRLIFNRKSVFYLSIYIIHQIIFFLSAGVLSW
jgi:hypothetical protein